MVSRLILTAMAAVVLLAVPPARAVEAPYEAGLLRLAEILGSLHFLRPLCGEEGEAWRAQMEALLETEKPDPALRARFIASFNRGYRTFEATYPACTASAAAAIALYMKEGEALARDIAARYGN
ncbi:MAG: TIGR02301 family protein [Rhizobiaceae bacterium]|nr:TIGR02301 family protein [Rhizobiaceae bacterium]